jgi:hypothetical protein
MDCIAAILTHTFFHMRQSFISSAVHMRQLLQQSRYTDNLTTLIQGFYGCKFWSFHSCTIEVSDLMGSDAGSLGEWFSTFRRNLFFSFSRTMKTKKNAPNDPWKWRQGIPSKRREPFVPRCSVTMRKSVVLLPAHSYCSTNSGNTFLNVWDSHLLFCITKCCRGRRQ